ncbi:MAG: carbohydrate ABC transporter permease [Treponema sp.]|jgi:putative aldouronate transport system permease protein|nr:carbohydrate ABC transporter permease [Treponema sp.]
MLFFKRIKEITIRKSASTIVFYVLSYLLITIIAFMCLLPFILLISGSFTEEKIIRYSGYSLLPKGFTLDAYKLAFRYPERVVRGYLNSIFITSIGTFTGLFLITMTAYVLSRKSFKYRNIIAFFFFFTTLFNGGMVSTYIFYIRYLHLKDSYLSMILPGLFNIFYLLIMRSFINTIPDALVESAKLDGAGEFTIFVRIIIPLLPSGLATIGLFLALGYWNDWYNAMLYVNTPAKFPLQYMLYDTLMRAQAFAQIASRVGMRVENLPTYSLKLAMAVVTTGPIILVYPFVQKYFIKGITIGSVKG